MPTESPNRKWGHFIVPPIAGLLGWMLYLGASDVRSTKTPPVVAVQPQPVKRPAATVPALPFSPQKTLPISQKSLPESSSPARPGELLVKFRSPAELEAFLARVRKMGGRVIALIPRLGAARIGFDSAAQGEAIRDLLPKTASADLNYLVRNPAPPDPQADTGGPYLGFGHEALTWLGVPTDNATWGRGIKVAVLDSGIYQVPGLDLKSIRQIDLLGSSANGGETPVHGTAVASIIGGTSAEARGVAPGAELLSIRVLDNDGVGDSFTVAQGVLDAVDNGARVISMSIGSTGDSAVLRDAVNYALDRNVAVVAAVGNDAVDLVYYPAQYPGVIAVTAVDANGQRGGFANYGQEVTLAAPGIGVATPWMDQQEINFSGTSAAVPFVSGTLARLFEENKNLTVAQATRLLTNYSDDAGAPGTDSYYGAGILNVNRIETRNQSGINDAAVADFYFQPQIAKNSSNGVPVEVTVQNRGTTNLSNLTLEITNNGQAQTFFLSGLAPGSVQSRTIQVSAAALQSEAGVSLQSRVQLPGLQDNNMINNRRAMTLRVKK